MDSINKKPPRRTEAERSLAVNCRKCKAEIPDNSTFCLACGIKQQGEPKKQSTKSRGNGTGSVYKLSNGKWRAAVTLGYDENKKRIYKTKSGFRTKKEGLEYLAKLRDSADAPKTIKFSALYTEWSDIHFRNISKSKETAYKIAYKKCEPFHYKNAAEIRTNDIQAAIDAASGGYYPKHDIKVLCNLMFKYAMQNDYVNKNYAQFVRLPPLPKSKRDAFNTNEIKALWKDYKDGNEFTGYILLLMYTGMRLGELQILQKDKIYIDKGYMIGGIKTEAGIDREIAIVDKIKPIIKKLCRLPGEKILGMGEKVFYEKYYDALERAKTRRLTPHCCRHTFATLMVESGASPEITQALLGHENYETTLQYTHISLAEKLKTANKI